MCGGGVKRLVQRTLNKTGTHLLRRYRTGQEGAMQPNVHSRLATVLPVERRRSLLGFSVQSIFTLQHRNFVHRSPEDGSSHLIRLAARTGQVSYTLLAAAAAVRATALRAE